MAWRDSIDAASMGGALPGYLAGALHNGDNFSRLETYGDLFCPVLTGETDLYKALERLQVE